MIGALENDCVNFLTANLDAKNVLSALEICVKRDVNSKLLENCRKYIQNNINELAKEWESLSVSHECLLFLLESLFSASNVELFKRLNFMVNTYCKVELLAFKF